jgi:hypothetical protein
MTRYITLSPDVVPLAYSGLELEVSRLAKELDEASQTRKENPGWFERPLDSLDLTCELLRVIAWPNNHPPVEAIVEIDTWRDILLGALQAELQRQSNHRDDTESGTELRGEATRAITVIDSFLADLPALEAHATQHKPKPFFADQETAERGIVLQVLRDDHDEKWTRAELQEELHDVEPQAVTAALNALREEDVAHLEGDLVWASRCARRLSDRGMVSI